MGWKERQQTNQLYYEKEHYSSDELWEAWNETLSSEYGDKLIYSLLLESNKPHNKPEKTIDANAAIFREGKRDLVQAVLNMADRYKGKERTDGNTTDRRDTNTNFAGHNRRSR